MPREYKLTVPQNLGELRDHIRWMMLKSPRFEDDYFGTSLDTAFAELEQGVLASIQKIGETRLQEIILKMRAARDHFEQHPDEKDHRLAGQKLLYEIDETLAGSAKRGAAATSPTSGA